VKCTDALRENVQQIDRVMVQTFNATRAFNEAQNTSVGAVFGHVLPESARRC
jgi:hypothetical protein